MIELRKKIEKEERGLKKPIKYTGDVVERLMNKAKENFQKKMEMIEQQTIQNTLECTFKPELNNNEIKLDNSNMVGTDFMTRQNTLIERRYLSAQKAEKNNMEKNCTFKPSINSISNYIAQEARSSYLEKDIEYQLYYLPVKKKAVLHAELSKQEEQKYKFQPSINRISKIIGKSKTFNDIADYTSKDEKNKKLKDSLLKKELEECYFKPKINRQSKEIKSRYKSVKSEDTVKKAVIDRQKEFEEIKDCTFKPKIHNYIKPETVEVKGLNGFIKKNMMAKKLKEDKKMREMKAFRPEQFTNNFGSKKNVNN